VRAAEEEEAGTPRRDPSEKQEPHTVMWGKISGFKSPPPLLVYIGHLFVFLFAVTPQKAYMLASAPWH